MNGALFCVAVGLNKFIVSEASEVKRILLDISPMRCEFIGWLIERRNGLKYQYPALLGTTYIEVVGSASYSGGKALLITWHEVSSALRRAAVVNEQPLT